MRELKQRINELRINVKWSNPQAHKRQLSENISLAQMSTRLHSPRDSVAVPKRTTKKKIISLEEIKRM